MGSLDLLSRRRLEQCAANPNYEPQSHSERHLFAFLDGQRSFTFRTRQSFTTAPDPRAPTTHLPYLSQQHNKDSEVLTVPNNKQSTEGQNSQVVADEQHHLLPRNDQAVAQLGDVANPRSYLHHTDFSDTLITVHDYDERREHEDVTERSHSFIRPLQD
jgi:hypothetical protein